MKYLWHPNPVSFLNCPSPRFLELQEKYKTQKNIEIAEALHVSAVIIKIIIYENLKISWKHKKKISKNTLQIPLFKKALKSCGLSLFF